MSRRIMLVFLVVFNVTLLAAILFNAPLEEARESVRDAESGQGAMVLRLAAGTGRVNHSSLRRLYRQWRLARRNTAAGIFAAVLTLWPWLDRSPLSARRAMVRARAQASERDLRCRDVAIIILIMVGVYLRGPYWRIYWPGQPRPEMPRLY